MARTTQLTALLVTLFLLAGCSRELVVLLPAADGHIGGVVIKTAGGTLLLDKAYAAASPGDSAASSMAPEDVQKAFGDVLAARPLPPSHHIVFFLNDSEGLTLESQAEFQQVFADVVRRAAPEIVITGHTDTLGSAVFADALSLRRAEAVKALLLSRQAGLPAGISITTRGRGARDAQSPPNVPDPRERYVDVMVR